MTLEKLGPGAQVRDAKSVVIEIPAHSNPVKYEVDKHLQPGRWVK